MAKFNMQYIYSDMFFFHVYAFNKRKDVEAFLTLNDIDVSNIQNCDGFVMRVKNRDKKYGERAVLYYKNDSALVHEIFHIAAIFNTRRLRVPFEFNMSEPHSHFGGWVWDSIKRKDDKKENRLLTGWEPIEVNCDDE